MPKKTKMNRNRFNKEAHTIRIDYLQPAIEKAADTLNPYTISILHAIFMSAYATCLVLTNGDPQRASGLFTDTAQLALQNGQEIIDPGSYTPAKE